jgi:hypothetical protein
MQQSTYPRNERDRQSPPYEKPGEIKSLNLRHRENEKRENPGLLTQTGKPLPHSPGERRATARTPRTKSQGKSTV